MPASHDSSPGAAIFQLDGCDVEVEAVAGGTAWRARVIGHDGDVRSDWVGGRRAWEAVESAVRGPGADDR